MSVNRAFDAIECAFDSIIPRSRDRHEEQPNMNASSVLDDTIWAVESYVVREQDG